MKPEARWIPLPGYPEYLLAEDGRVQRADGKPMPELDDEDARELWVAWERFWRPRLEAERATWGRFG